MANYFLTETAQFKPFSYQEMLAPIKAYQDAYNEADEKLNLLLEDAATKAFNFAPQDTAEKAIYDNMMVKLKEASDKLSSGDPTAFKTIREVNKDYRKTMIPIQQRMAKRAELATEQRTKSSNNPYLRYSKDYSTANLGDITSASSYDTIDLSKLEESISSEFLGEVATNIRDDFEPVAIGNTGHYAVTTGYGYTPTEFVDAFIGNKGKPKENSPIYQFYKKKADAIDKMTNYSPEIRNEMKQSVYNAMEANAGKFSVKTVAGKTSSTSGSNAWDAMWEDSEGNTYHKKGTLIVKNKDTNPVKLGDDKKSEDLKHTFEGEDGYIYGYIGADIYRKNPDGTLTPIDKNNFSPKGDKSITPKTHFKTDVTIPNKVFRDEFLDREDINETSFWRSDNRDVKKSKAIERIKQGNLFEHEEYGVGYSFTKESLGNDKLINYLKRKFALTDKDLEVLGFFYSEDEKRFFVDYKFFLGLDGENTQNTKQSPKKKEDSNEEGNPNNPNQTVEVESNENAF